MIQGLNEILRTSKDDQGNAGYVRLIYAKYSPLCVRGL